MSKWSKANLGSLILLEYGASLPERARSGHGLPVVGSAGIVGHHAVASRRGPGIVVGRKGTVGALTWLDGDFSPIDTTYWVRAIRELDLRWLYLAMEELGLRRLDSSTGVPGLNRHDAYRLSVEVPPLSEQQRIAEILDTLDDAVAVAERIIAKLVRHREGLVLAAMNEVSTGEWQSLGTLIRKTRPIVYGILMPGEDVDDGVPVVKVKDIIDGAVESSGLFRTSRAIHAAYIRSALEAGDILFSIRGSVGRTAVVPASLSGGNITQDTARIAADGVSPEFILAAFEQPRFRRYIATHTIGQAVRGINLRELREAPIPVVSTEGRSMVASTYTSAAKRLRCARERAAKLHSIRAGLAQDLLSGRVRTVTT